MTGPRGEAQGKKREAGCQDGSEKADQDKAKAKKPAKKANKAKMIKAKKPAKKANKAKKPVKKAVKAKKAKK